MWIRNWLRRSFAAAVLLALLAYPSAVAVGTPQLPIALRCAWVALAAGAALWPQPSLWLFLAAVPLTPILPVLYRWPPVSLPELWLTALALPALARAVLRPRRAGTPLAVPLLVLIATASLLVTLLPLEAVWESRGAFAREIHSYVWTALFMASAPGHLYASLQTWLIWCAGAGTCWLVLWHLPRHQATAIERAFVAFFVGGVAVSILGIRQWWTGAALLPFWREVDPYITRINATFTDVNGLASYLVGVLPIGVALLGPHRLARAAVLAGLAVITAAIVLTASRIAWLACGLTVIAAVAVLLRNRALASGDLRAGTVRGGRALVAAAVILVALLVAVAAARNLQPGQQRSYADVVLYTLNPRVPLEARLKGRWALWQAGASMVRARPVDGIGLGRFYKDVSAYSADPARLVRPRENAHNYFLQVAAELGLPAAALLVSVLMVPLLLLKGQRPLDSGAPTLIRLGAAGAWGVWMSAVTWLTGHALLVPEGQIVFWAQFALVIAALRASDPVDRERGRAPAAMAWLCAAVVVLTLPGRVAAAWNRVNLTGVESGLYDVERDARDEEFRWTMDRAVFFVPTNARVFELRVRSLAPHAQTITVVVDGRVSDTLALADHAWRDLRYTVPAASRLNFHRFEFRVDPVWQAPADARVLGVMVADINWR